MTTPSPALVQWVALSLIPGLGGKSLARLLEHCGSLDAIFRASESDLRAVPRIGPKLAAAIRSIRLEQTQAEIEMWLAEGIRLLRPADEAYPPPLRALEDAPPVLFWRGKAEPSDRRAVALVGTRRPTAEGTRLAGMLAAALTERGWCVISGLAAGIDTAAHRGALRAEGTTLAVLGSGVRAIYPPENKRLAEAIIGQGALLGEVHPDAKPNSPALVARNRIISGLSDAVIVIEAGAASGSLHAARFATQQGRLVGALDSRMAGNRFLISAGALPIPLDPASWPVLFDALMNHL